MDNCVHIINYVNLHNYCNNKNIIIHIHAPVPSPTVMVTQLPNTILFIGSNFTINCVIMLNKEIVTSGTNVSAKWTGPLERQNTSVQQSSKNSLQYKTQLYITEASLNHSGNYSCEARVMATNFQFLLPSLLSVDTITVDISK